MAGESAAFSNPWLNSPQRQAFFVGDVVEVTVRLTRGSKPRVFVCRVEAAYDPAAFHGRRQWEYSVRPVDGPNPHALHAGQSQLSLHRVVTTDSESR